MPVKCICDAGLFLDVDTVTGAGKVMQTRYHDIADIMESKPGLSPACVGNESDWRQCIFRARLRRLASLNLGLQLIGLLSQASSASHTPPVLNACAQWSLSAAAMLEGPGVNLKIRRLFRWRAL